MRRLTRAVVDYESNLPSHNLSSDVSWIGSVQGCMLMLLGPIAGTLYDAGYFRQLLIGGLFLIIFGQFMTSLAREYYQVVLAQGLCAGTGMGLTFLPTTAILSQYFSGGRLALVLGLASSGSPMAGIIFPIIFSKIQMTLGFSWATRVIAFILLGLSVVPIAAMHTRHTTAGEPGEADGHPQRPKSRRALFDPTVLRNPALMVFTAGSFFFFLTLYIPFFYIQVFAEKHGMASATGFAPYLVTLLNVGSVFGRILPNALAGLFGSIRMATACASVSAVLAFCWLAIPRTRDIGGLIAFALLYGGFSGGIVSLAPSVVVELSPEDLSRVGTRLGMVFMVQGVALLVGPPIAGAILGDFSASGWVGTIAFGAAGLSLASVLLTASAVLDWKRGQGRGRAAMKA